MFKAFFKLGGRRWIRTIEAKLNRFTVCPLWPLGNSPISSFSKIKAYCLNSRLQWSWWTDLNPRPADYKSAALPTELHQLELSFVLLIQATITVYHLSRVLSSTFFMIYRMLIFAGLGQIYYIIERKARNMPLIAIFHAARLIFTKMSHLYVIMIIPTT